jgi:hypothetical protein
MDGHDDGENDDQEDCATEAEQYPGQKDYGSSSGTLRGKGGLTAVASSREGSEREDGKLPTVHRRLSREPAAARLA